MTDEAINRLAEAIERLAEVLTEKGEKENPPHPLKEKTQKEIPNPRARACEETEFVRYFGEFWSAYPSECPRKVGRKKCGAKYASLMRNAKDPAALHAAILAGIERWRRSQDWVEDEGKFIKSPLVWLNQENWNDSPAPFSPRRAANQAERAAEDCERLREVRSAAVRRNAVAALTERDWALCRESGCRHCGACGCRVGVALPPDHRLNQRPCRPEECPAFEEGGAA